MLPVFSQYTHHEQHQRRQLLRISPPPYDASSRRTCLVTKSSPSFKSAVTLPQAHSWTAHQLPTCSQYTHDKQHRRMSVTLHLTTFVRPHYRTLYVYSLIFLQALRLLSHCCKHNHKLLTSCSPFYNTHMSTSITHVSQFASTQVLPPPLPNAHAYSQLLLQALYLHSDWCSCFHGQLTRCPPARITHISKDVQYRSHSVAHHLLPLPQLNAHVRSPLLLRAQSLLLHCHKRPHEQLASCPPAYNAHVTASMKYGSHYVSQQHLPRPSPNAHAYLPLLL